MDARERILSAARRIFASKGFKGATTRDIASEAAVAEVTLFRQFGSKESLLLEVMGPALRRSVQRIQEDAAGKSAEEVLADLCRSRLECSRENADLMAMVWTEIHVNPLVRDAFRKTISDSADTLARVLYQGPETERASASRDKTTGVAASDDASVASSGAVDSLTDSSLAKSWMILGSVFGVAAFLNLYGDEMGFDRKQSAKDLATMLTEGAIDRNHGRNRR